METVKLMNRMDQKFLAPIGQLGNVLEAAREHYRVLEISSQRQMGYESLYFDTVDHRMYLDHHNRRLNRYKVRIRQYLDSKQFFLEVKFKTNKGQTRKTRIVVDGYEALNTPEGADFVLRTSNFPVSVLEPKLFTTFKRITLVSPERMERITIDTDLILHHQSNTFELPFLCIIELKSERLSGLSGFRSILLEQRIFSRKLSKYCTATNLLYPDVKKNRFLGKLRYLNKLENLNKYELHTSTR